MYSSRASNVTTVTLATPSLTDVSIILSNVESASDNILHLLSSVLSHIILWPWVSAVK